MSRVGLVVSLSLAASLPGLGSPVAALQATHDSAFDRIAACTHTNRRLIALFLVDESQSLQTTDPRAERVTAAKVAIAALATLPRLRTSEAPPEVHVLLAGFSSSLTPAGPWVVLTDSSADDLARRTETFAERAAGIDTDYVAALDGARQALAERSSELARSAGDTCKVVILFSDGKFDIEDRNSATSGRYGNRKPWAPDIALDQSSGGRQAVERGRTLVCRPGGIADELRADGVVTIAVALTAALQPADEAFLQALATGAAGAQACGASSGEASGAYVAAPQLAELVQAFHTVANRLSGGSALGCTPSSCYPGGRAFIVDPGIRRFHLLATTSQTATAQMSTPTGATVILGSEPLTREGSGFRLSHRWLAPGALVVDTEIDRGDRRAAGTWTVSIADPRGVPDGAATVQVFAFSDLAPRLLGEPRLLRGEPGELRVGVVDGDSVIQHLDRIVRSTSLEADVVSSDRSGPRWPLPEVAPHPDGTFSVTLRPPADVSDVSIELSLRLAVTTLSGLELAPSVRLTRVPIDRPGDFPAIGPTDLRLSPVIGARPAVGTITVRASPNADACVWLEGIDVTASPSSVDGFGHRLEPQSQSAATCTAVRRGQALPLRLLVEPMSVAAGSVRGSVRLGFTNSNSEREETAVIPFRFEMSRPVDRERQAGIFVVLVALSLVVPLAAFHLLNRRAAKFGGASDLLWAESFVPDGGRAIDTLASAPNFAPVRLLKKSRVIEAGPLTMRARVPLSPFGSPHGTAVADDGSYVISSVDNPGRPGRAARVSLLLGGEAVLVVPSGYFSERSDRAGESEPDTSASGPHPTLVVMASVGVKEEHTQRAHARVADLASELEALRNSVLKASEEAAAPPRGRARPPSRPDWDSEQRPPRPSDW